jgi:phosphatidylglycerol lysyltransferase
MKKKSPVRFVGPLIVVTIFVVAAVLLYSELKRNDLTPRKILDSVLQIPNWQIAVALGLTVVNYGILVGYDYLAFLFADVPISLARVTFAALAGYAFSYNFGATLAGVPMRYRLYSAWGLPLTKIVQLLVILALTFWFGVFFISGLLFVFDPLRIPDEQLQAISQALLQKIPPDAVEWFKYLFSDSRPFGVLLLVLTGLYVITNFVADALVPASKRQGRSGSLKILRWTLPVPPFRLTFYQIGIASADMLVAGSVLHALFPPIHGGYLTILEVYLVVYVLIVLSHVPGGWGVLELGMMTLLGTLRLVPDPATNMPKVVAGIIVFRVIYFLLPLLLAAAMVGWHEYALRKKWIRPLVTTSSEPDSGIDSPGAIGRLPVSAAATNGKSETGRPQPEKKV